MQMNNSDIETTILAKLYSNWDPSSPEGEDNINVIRNQGGWDSSTFYKVVERMTHDRLIQVKALHGAYEITSDGIICAEEKGIADQNCIAVNRRTRTQLLDTLYDVYEDGGCDGTEHYQTLSETTGLGINLLLENLSVLADLGCVEWVDGGFCRITSHGINVVDEGRRKNTLIMEFEEMAKMRPQQRGRLFQKLLARVIEGEGWSQDEGIRTSHEEMDIIVFSGREYYLTECKWEKDPIEARVVRELFGKLGNRIDVRGILISMSGFSSGAIDQVKDYVNRRVILVFGPEDIHNILYRRSSFDDLLNQKYKELVIHKRVMFD